MKTYFKKALILSVGLAFCLSAAAQKPADLVGTWFGTAAAEGETDTNDLTLVLELKEGNLAGTMSDQMGALIDAPCSDFKIEKGVFSFIVTAPAQGVEMKITFTMKVDGDSMKGEFDMPEMGMSGTWEATRQK